MIKIEIWTDSAAMSGERRSLGIAEVLESLASKMRSNFDYPTTPFPPKMKREAYPLFDLNGNTVGRIWEGHS